MYQLEVLETNQSKELFFGIKDLFAGERDRLIFLDLQMKLKGIEFKEIKVVNKNLFSKLEEETFSEFWIILDNGKIQADYCFSHLLSSSSINFLNFTKQEEKIHESGTSKWKIWLRNRRKRN